MSPYHWHSVVRYSYVFSVRSSSNFGRLNNNGVNDEYGVRPEISLINR